MDHLTKQEISEKTNYWVNEIKKDSDNPYVISTIANRLTIEGFLLNQVDEEKARILLDATLELYKITLEACNRMKNFLDKNEHNS